MGFPTVRGELYWPGMVNVAAAAAAAASTASSDRSWTMLASQLVSGYVHKVDLVSRSRATFELRCACPYAAWHDQICSTVREQHAGLQPGSSGVLTRCCWRGELFRITFLETPPSSAFQQFHPLFADAVSGPFIFSRPKLMFWYVYGHVAEYGA